eukprot:12983768-Heterocapsa_arctica.AAC.1
MYRSSSTARRSRTKQVATPLSNSLLDDRHRLIVQHVVNALEVKVVVVDARQVHHLIATELVHARGAHSTH